MSIAETEAGTETGAKSELRLTLVPTLNAETETATEARPDC